MDIAVLVDRLADPSQDVQIAAGNELIALGATAVGPVLAVLCDVDSPVSWSRSGWVLERIGDAAFEPLVAAMVAASDPEVARRTGFAFGRLDVSDKALYLPTLSHPHPAVRSCAAYALQLARADALPHVPALLPLLADPVEDVRQRALWALAEIGTGVLPLLRDVRRTPGRLRRPALTALAEVGGWDALEPVDRALVHRLIGVKAPGEVPAPMHVCGSWYALPTSDQAAVLDAFGLSDPVRVTMRLGESVWNQDHHDWSSRNPHTKCARVYVSPALDGWTLVFGDPSDDAHKAERDDDEDPYRDVVRRHSAELSVRFGAARWYGMSCGDDWTAWCIAEQGEVVRYYDIEDAHDSPDETGSHPAEAGYLLPHEDGFPPDAFDGVNPSDSAAFQERYTQVKRDLGIPDSCDATTIAGRVSVDPTALGAGTRVEGHGVVALTACGRRYGTPPGALDV